MQAAWTDTQQKLDASITKNLAVNSAKIDNLVRESSAASQEQIRQFVSGNAHREYAAREGLFPTQFQ